MITAYMIILLTIIAISITLNIKVKINYDITNNIGHIEFSLFWLKIINFDIKFYGLFVNLYKRGKKIKTVQIKFDTPSIKFFNSLQKIFFKKIYIKQLEFYSIIGSNNACVDSIIAGSVNVVCGVCVVKLINRYQYLKYSYKSECDYTNNNLQFILCTNLSISILDFIWSIFVTLYLRGVYVKDSRARKQQIG